MRPSLNLVNNRRDCRHRTSPQWLPTRHPSGSARVTVATAAFLETDTTTFAEFRRAAKFLQRSRVPLEKKSALPTSANVLSAKCEDAPAPSQLLQYRKLRPHQLRRHLAVTGAELVGSHERYRTSSKSGYARLRKRGSNHSWNRRSNLPTRYPVMKTETTFAYSLNRCCSLWYGASSIHAPHPAASPRAADSRASVSFGRLEHTLAIAPISGANT